MTLGEKIRKKRLQLGLTQSELAEGCVTRNMLSQIEHDAARPSMRTLEHLARTLGVSLGWLLEDTPLDPAAVLTKAREHWQRDEWEACLALLEEEQTEQESLMLLALCAGRLAEIALAEEQFRRAEQLAQQALSAIDRCIYPLPGTEVTAAAVVTRCRMADGEGAEEAVTALRERYLRAQTAVRCHLVLARYHLEQEHVQAAEREIWSIAELPEENRAEYLILRGRIANKKEQFENAALYFQQAEELQPLPKLLLRELYAGLERCYKETEQYQLAYEYATRQREL